MVAVMQLGKTLGAPNFAAKGNNGGIFRPRGSAAAGGVNDEDSSVMGEAHDRNSPSWEDITVRGDRSRTRAGLFPPIQG